MGQGKFPFRIKGNKCRKDDRVENLHFTTPNKIVDLGKGHKWMLKSLSPHRLLINYKGKHCLYFYNGGIWQTQS